MTKKIKSPAQPIHILLVFLGACTGVLVMAQFGSPPSQIVDPFEPFQELQESIDILSHEQVQLQENIGNARKEVEKLENLILGGSRKTTLDELKSSIGLTDVTGAGLKILLDDGPSELIPVDGSQSVCYAADLRDIINILRVSSSAAIAINDQRIIDRTSIVCVGQNVLVNNVRMLPPFTIFAAMPGNTDTAITYLQTEKFLPDLYHRARSGEILFRITKEGEITIPVYKGNLEIKFAR